MDGRPYPFLKNRFFPQKRMRAVDFQREQAFYDGKAAFLSHWLFGTGVVLGLGVQRVDGDSLLVEPGFGVDPQGRLVIVDEPALRRLRTLEGFGDAAGDTAVLWLAFAEEEREPVFAPGAEVDAQTYAAAREGFRFFLTGGADLPTSEAEEAVYSRTLLYADDEVRVTQRIPKVLSGTGVTQLGLEVLCLSPEPVEVEITYTPRVPGFTGVDGKNPPELREKLRLGKGEIVRRLPIRPVCPGQTVFISLEEGDFLLEKRGQRKSALGGKEGFRGEFSVTVDDPAKELAARLTALSPQELWDVSRQGVPLAVLRLVRGEDQALLDDVIALHPRRRAGSPWLADTLGRLAEDCWPKARPAEGETPAKPAEGKGTPVPQRRRSATGVVTLQTGLHRGEGNILTSEELSHGLGPGTVYVEFGVENVYPVANDDRNRTDLLLGDVTLFEQPSETYDVDFDKGVRLHPEKGTFALAVRPRGHLRQTTLRLRWFAWRPEGGEEGVPERAGTLVRLEPDLVRVKPGAVVQFTPVFEGGSVPCDFATEGKRSGSVTQDGVYTAPDRPGLFQVWAQVRGGGQERAEGFVIVDGEDGDGPDSL